MDVLAFVVESIWDDVGGVDLFYALFGFSMDQRCVHIDVPYCGHVKMIFILFEIRSFGHLFLRHDIRLIVFFHDPLNIRINVRNLKIFTSTSIMVTSVYFT